jgi:hypothetical protein
MVVCGVMVMVLWVVVVVAMAVLCVLGGSSSQVLSFFSDHTFHLTSPPEQYATPGASQLILRNSHPV